MTYTGRRRATPGVALPTTADPDRAPAHSHPDVYTDARDAIRWEFDANRDDAADRTMTPAQSRTYTQSWVTS